MLKRLIFIILFFILLGFSAKKMTKFIRATTEDLKIESELKWKLYLEAFETLPEDFILLTNDTTNLNLKSNLIKDLDKITNASNKTITEDFLKDCYDFNEKYMGLKKYLKDSLSLVVLTVADKKFDTINYLSNKYNEVCRKHNNFIGSMPNLYLIKRENRRRLPYLSIKFNHDNLDPLIHKNRFDKYMETGQDRFLKEPTLSE